MVAQNENTDVVSWSVELIFPFKIKASLVYEKFNPEKIFDHKIKGKMKEPEVPLPDTERQLQYHEITS